MKIVVKEVLQPMTVLKLYVYKLCVINNYMTLLYSLSYTYPTRVKWIAEKKKYKYKLYW